MLIKNNCIKIAQMKHVNNLSKVVFLFFLGINFLQAQTLDPVIENPDVIGAFAAGFVNPYAAGYSSDVFCCWAILLVWVIYEAPKVKYGWICLLIGVVPGVAVGLAAYLIIRTTQLKNKA